MRRALPTITALTLAALLVIPASTAGARSKSGKKGGDSQRRALKADRDRDGMADRWERAYRLSPRVDDSRRDVDDDGLNNLEEFNGDTDPRNPDSDGNGVLDGDENGEILSYDVATGMLRVAMPGGHRLRGIVDEDTLIFCEPAEVDSGPGSFSARGARGGNADVTPVDPGTGPDLSDPSLFDDECGVENLIPGAQVLYVDVDGGYFADITLDEYPLPEVG